MISESRDYLNILSLANPNKKSFKFQHHDLTVCEQNIWSRRCLLGFILLLLGDRGQPLGRWEMASILPISQAGDGRWLALSGGGRRDRSPHNPKGDGRFYKNWSVSHWEMGYLSKITHLPVGDWEILTLCPPPPVETKII